MHKPTLLLILIAFGLKACIKDDLLDNSTIPILKITTPLDSLGISDTFQLKALYLDNVGKDQAVDLLWKSSDTTIISVHTTQGWLYPKQYGTCQISVQLKNDSSLKDVLEIPVGQYTILKENQRHGTVATTSNYALSGDFTLSSTGNNLLLSFSDNYIASTALPGLYLYLSNNSNSSADALEIGPVTVFQGAHSYTISDVHISDYSYVLYFCKPFNAKVGHGAIQ